MKNKLTQEKIKKAKIISIVGQTTTGKSDLAVLIAKKFKGEIISVDSRQVYKFLNLGTGKVNVKPCKKNKNILCYKNIPHYLIDVISPKKIFSVAKFQKLAQKALKKIIQKNKIPILCGGSAFYFYAFINNYQLPKVKPDLKLRKKLIKKDIKELIKIIKKFKPNLNKKIDFKNKQRLIRKIEILKKLKKIPPLIKKPLQNKILILGLKKDKKTLKKLIYKRIIKRIKQGMIKEVKDLNKKHKLSFKKIKSFGLEYKYITLYLQKKITKQEMIDKLTKSILNFSKRQMTWFKKDKKIIWIKNKKQAFKLIQKFLQ